MKKLRTSTIISSVICLALGIALVCHPIKAALTFYLVIGGGLFILGAIYCLSYLLHKNKEDKKTLDIVIGIPTIIMGVCVLIFYTVAVNIIQYVMGALIIIHGICNMSQALRVKKLGYKKWGTVMLLGVITLLLGVLLMCAPFAQVISINVIAGIFLIFDALSDLYVYARVATSEEGKAAAAAEREKAKSLKQGAAQTATVNTSQSEAPEDGAVDKPQEDEEKKWHW